MSATCKQCAGSMERRGAEQICYACKDAEIATLKKNSNVQIVEVWMKKVDDLEKDLEDHKANHNTVKWTELLGKRMNQIAELEKENAALKEEVRCLELTEGKTMVNCNHYGEGFVPNSQYDTLKTLLSKAEKALEEIVKERVFEENPHLCQFSIKFQDIKNKANQNLSEIRKVKG